MEKFEKYYDLCKANKIEMKDIKDKLRILKCNTIEYRIIYSILFSIYPFCLMVLFIYLTKISIDSYVLSFMLTIMPFIMGIICMFIYFRINRYKDKFMMLCNNRDRESIYELEIMYQIKYNELKEYNRIIMNYIDNDKDLEGIESTYNESLKYIRMNSLDKLSYQYMDKFSNDSCYSYMCIFENSLMIGIVSMLVLGITNLMIRDYFLDKSILFYVIVGVLVTIIYMLYDIKRSKIGYGVIKNLINNY